MSMLRSSLCRTTTRCRTAQMVPDRGQMTFGKGKTHCNSVGRASIAAARADDEDDVEMNRRQLIALLSAPLFMSVLPAKAEGETEPGSGQILRWRAHASSACNTSHVAPAEYKLFLGMASPPTSYGTGGAGSICEPGLALCVSCCRRRVRWQRKRRAEIHV